MKFKLRVITSLIVALVVCVIPFKVAAIPSTHNDKVFNSSSFNTQNNNVNLIVNDLYETPDGLVLDAYLYNTTGQTFSKINNFNLEIRDGNGVSFARKTFDQIDISGQLMPLQGKRISLFFDRNSYDLKDKNFKNITWNFRYNYK